MRESRWQQFDFVLLAAVGGLLLIGLAMIHSATCIVACAGIFPPSSYAVRQGTFAFLGIGALVVVSLLDYRFYRAYAYQIYAAGLLLLMAVLVIGSTGADDDYGAKRWISLGLFDLQASEVGKITTLIALARILGDKPEGPLSLRRLLTTVVVAGVAAGLVFAEPDFGTSLSYVATWLVLVLVAGMRWRHGAGLALATVASLPLVWFVLMKEYQKDRVMTFIGTLTDVEHAAFDEGYNILQAKISIGSGGLVGRGYMQGTQTQLEFLRIQHSDFIFSALAEELGFVGAMLLFGLFVVLLFRITRAGDRSRDEFGRYAAFGIATMLLFQAVANLGANLTLLPVTGIPLPFISYGRTALLTNLLALGIVESVLLYRVRYRY